MEIERRKPTDYRTRAAVYRAHAEELRAAGEAYRAGV